MDFNFREHGALLDGRCIVEVPLPERTITRLRTGQFSTSREHWAMEVVLE